MHYTDSVITEYEKKKAPLISTLQGLQAKFVAKQATLEQLEPQIVDLSDTFNEVLYDCWRQLMTIEMNLFEQCEVSS